MTATIALAVLGIFVAYFPVNAVSGSLSTIASATGAGITQVQWISAAYVIPMAAAVLSAGVFGDRYGRRRVFSIGATLTVLGAGIAALSSLFGDGALPVLLTGQVFAGLGGGILLPTTLALIAVAVPDPRQRGRYIALWATGTGASLALGPIASGLILKFVGWGWIFVPTLVLAAIAAVIAHVKLPESRSPERRSLDVPGQIIASIAIIALTVGVIEGGARGWTSASALIGLVVAVIAVVAFITVEHRTAAPLMDLQLFKISSFSAANFGAFMALFSIVGVVFLISLYLGATQQLSALEIGVRIIFVPGISALVNPIIGCVLAHTRPIYMLSAGLLVGAIGTLAISGIHANTGYVDLIWRLAIFGVANAMMLTAASVSAINAVPVSFAGMAAATNTALRQLGAALAPAVLGTIYAGAMAHDGGSATAGVNTAMLTTTGLLLLSSLACAVTTVLDKKR
ncbi:MAG: MFS transporter [Paeniglutamicibacter terrestris]